MVIIFKNLVRVKDILKKEIDEYRLSSLKLDGLTLDDDSKIKEFDSKYENFKKSK